MTQRERIYQLLVSGPVCPSDWRNEFPRMAARIEELRAQHTILTRPCERVSHWHRSARQIEYVLEPTITLF